VIASAREPAVVSLATAGEAVGTWITPHGSRLPARKLWIAFGLPAEGSLAVDAGAARALLDGKRSLLAVGITRVEGSFSPDCAVEITDPEGAVIGKGLVSMTADEVEQSIGRHSSEVGGVVVHRDDLVVLDSSPNRLGT
jgi:glutamate 5-kinase